MARYRIGETAEMGPDVLTQDVFIGAAVFGLLMSIGFVYAGLRGKQYWIAIWGAGLNLSSIAYLLYIFVTGNY